MGGVGCVLFNWVRSSGRTSSSSPSGIMGVVVVLSKISLIVDGISSVSGKGRLCLSWLSKNRTWYELMTFLDSL